MQSLPMAPASSTTADETRNRQVLARPAVRAYRPASAVRATSVGSPRLPQKPLPDTNPSDVTAPTPLDVSPTAAGAPPAGAAVSPPATPATTLPPTELAPSAPQLPAPSLPPLELDPVATVVKTVDAVGAVLP